MKILILSNQSRSMANFWSVLIRHMRAAGHEVVCCAPPGDAAAETALRALGAEFVPYPLDRKGLNPLRDAESFLALARIFRAQRPDLLFATTIKPVIYGCLAARVAGVPRVYATITGLGYAFEADSLFKRCVNRLGVFLYWLALRHARGVFFQNQDDVRVFREQGILGPDAHVLTARGTGVDTARFAPEPFPPLPPAGPVIFLLVGRLLEAKGIAEYAEAGRLLRAMGLPCRLQLLGPPEPGLGGVDPARIRRWEADGLLEYLGETRDVRPFLAAAHALVLPSWREGTPTAVMEAMSMGRPAVVTDVPGCREVVRDGVNGFLTPPRAPEALAEAMARLVSAPGDIARMGAAGRKLALDEFDADIVAARILRDMGVPGAAEATLEEKGERP